MSEFYTLPGYVEELGSGLRTRQLQWTCSLVPRPCGGGKQWPENEAMNLPGHVGGARSGLRNRKWTGKEATAMNCQSRLRTCGTF